MISIRFSKEHEDILAHCKELIEYQNGQITIHPRFNKLITALRTAAENGEGMLDKDAARHDDLMTPSGYRCNSGISVFCIILFRYFSGSLIISTQRDRHSGGSNGYAK